MSKAKDFPGSASVLNVEGVAPGLVEPDPGVEIELADSFCVEKRDRKRHQVVAVDDALIGKTPGGPDFDLRADTTDPPLCSSIVRDDVGAESRAAYRPVVPLRFPLGRCAHLSAVAGMV
jgi:hypothetical protein